MRGAISDNRNIERFSINFHEIKKNFFGYFCNSGILFVFFFCRVLNIMQCTYAAGQFHRLVCFYNPTDLFQIRGKNPPLEVVFFACAFLAFLFLLYYLRHCFNSIYLFVCFLLQTKNDSNGSEKKKQKTNISASPSSKMTSQPALGRFLCYFSCCTILVILSASASSAKGESSG